LSSLLGAAIAAGKQAEAGAPDARVSVAFALGWQMAELYRPGARQTSPSLAGRLPGLSRLTGQEWTDIGLDQLQAGVTKLREPIEAAGLDMPDPQQLQSKLAPLSEAQRAEALRAFHVDLLSTLTAADFRLGKAYGLGRALADTTREPAEYNSGLATHRVSTLSGWIRDLATAFPPHAGKAVVRSLEAWSTWAASGPGDPKMVAQLRAQGRLWRSLLSGEKRSSDMLEISDYARAAEGLVKRTGALAWSFLKRYWWAAALALLLFAGGVATMLSVHNPAAIVSGAAGVLASVGITWKGAGTSLGRSLARVEEPLWGAEVDEVVYERITPDAVVKAQPFRPGPDEPSLLAHA
jgi:hypothetical protein